MSWIGETSKCVEEGAASCTQRRWELTVLVDVGHGAVQLQLAPLHSVVLDTASNLQMQRGSGLENCRSATPGCRQAWARARTAAAAGAEVLVQHIAVGGRDLRQSTYTPARGARGAAGPPASAAAQSCRRPAGLQSSRSGRACIQPLRWHAQGHSCLNTMQACNQPCGLHAAANVDAACSRPLPQGWPHPAVV